MAVATFRHAELGRRAVRLSWEVARGKRSPLSALLAPPAPSDPWQMSLDRLVHASPRPERPPQFIPPEQFAPPIPGR